MYRYVPFLSAMWLHFSEKSCIIQCVRRIIFFLMLLSLLEVRAGGPLLRAGIISDTHVTEDSRSAERTRLAMRLFKSHGVDTVWHLGDLADKYSPVAFTNYRQAVESSFSGSLATPRFLFALAGHDRNDFPKSDGLSNTDRCHEAYRRMLAILGSDQAIEGVYEVAGFPVMIFCEDAWGGSDAKIATVEERYPGKPIFILDHEPGFDTTFQSVGWGDKRRQAIYERHPNVVHVSGHTHGPLRTARNIWQGNHTEYSAACLQKWEGIEMFLPRRSRQEAAATVLEVYADRLVFRRFDVMEGEEVAPFVVPWPFEAKTAPYRLEARKAADVAPQFPEAAHVDVVRSNVCDYVCTFPPARHPEEVHRYEVALEKRNADGPWTVYSFAEPYGELEWSARKVPARREIVFPACLFQNGETCRFVVVPISAWGTRGAALAGGPFVVQGVPEVEPVGMSEVPLTIVKDGYHRRSALPAALTKGVKKGDMVRFEVELTAEGDMEPSVHLNGASGIFTPWAGIRRGIGRPARLVQEIRVRNDDESFAFTVMGCNTGSVTLHGVQTFKLSTNTKKGK